MAADKAGSKALAQTQKRVPSAANVVKKVTPVGDVKPKAQSDESRGKVVRGVKRVSTPAKTKSVSSTTATKPGVKRVVKLSDVKEKKDGKEKKVKGAIEGSVKSDVAPKAELPSKTKDVPVKKAAVKAKETPEKQKETTVKAKEAPSKKKSAKATTEIPVKKVPVKAKQTTEKATEKAPAKNAKEIPTKKRAIDKTESQTKKKAKKSAEEPEDDEHMLSGFPEDSEEEDEEDDALAGRAGPTEEEVVRLPSSRDDATVRQRLDRAKAQHKANPESKKGVVYVGRLPRGFEEKQLRAYFSQFGDVERLRVSRNKKTGNSKHYAFIEFSSREVAEIVVDTMNNYLLDGHLLQMAMIPEDEVNPNLWIGAERKFHRVPTDRIERVRRSRARNDKERESVNKKLLAREKARRKRLANLGIEYDFPGYQK